MVIKNGYLYLNDITIKKKKITGHSFVDLCSLNPFSKKGDCVLNMLGVYKPPFDNKYLYRGDIAEVLVLKKMQEKYKDIKLIRYTEEDKKANNYDFFHEYVNCGGIPDIIIPDISLVEVKSKSMKDYDKISNGDIPKHELYQGLYY